MCHVPVTYFVCSKKFCLSTGVNKMEARNFTTHEQIFVELYSNGEKMSEIARSVSRSLDSGYWVIGKFQRSWLLENVPRSGRPRSMGDWEYRKLQRIANRDRLAPLGEITTRFNENRPTSVSKTSIKQRLKDNGFYRGVYRKKLWSKLSTERNACRGVGTRGGGLQEISGQK